MCAQEQLPKASFLLLIVLCLHLDAFDVMLCSLELDVQLHLLFCFTLFKVISTAQVLVW